MNSLFSYRYWRKSSNIVKNDYKDDEESLSYLICCNKKKYDTLSSTFFINKINLEKTL